MPSTRRTRSNAGNPETPATNTGRAAKRPRQPPTQQPSLDSNDGQSSADNEPAFELGDLTLQNYHQHKKNWPLARIQAQLARQAASNHQLSAAVIAEGQALLEALDHTVHMLAMVAGVSLPKLKRSLGMVGGTHGENPWHRWLSFSLDANKIPMPVRGAPDAGEQLIRRNKVNSTTYQALEDDEFMVFTSKIFYALGGYPDYSSVTVTEDPNVFGDSSILVPEVPKLSTEDENRYRPIYEKLVDLKKVDRDRKLNTAAASNAKEEKRSLQSIKKIAQQLARDQQLMGVDYYLIACSNNNTGGGWCQEFTTRDEISKWVQSRAQLQRVFPLYCQNGEILDEIKAVAAQNQPFGTQNVSNNRADIDKKTLGGKLSEMLEAVLGYKPGVGRGFPRTPNPIEGIKGRKLPIIVERASDSTMTDEQFQKGFTGMDAKERRKWIDDINSGKFKIRKLTSNENGGTVGGGETSSQAGGGGGGETSTEAAGGGGSGDTSNETGDTGDVH
ncbi:hypothetical protein DFH28DRAFT_1122041 [Melampsora americana]|nr:hypothetical protein DFH28DRAFT_1122041 [Melampsora americana]